MMDLSKEDQELAKDLIIKVERQRKEFMREHGIGKSLAPEMEQRLENDFSYHSPDEDKKDLHNWVRESLKEQSKAIIAELPPGREASLFLTKMEEAMFWANAAIARNNL